MNVNNVHGSLSQHLSELTYNGGRLETSTDRKSNIYFGVGLWSAQHGLSEGLPVDIMQLLLSATLMRLKVMEENPGKNSRVFLLIADSLAMQEGAKKEQVVKIVHIYKRSIESLLELLQLRNCCKIILSSDVENCEEYKKELAVVKASQFIGTIKKESQNYACTQTAITRYMNQHWDVGIKVGWTCETSKSRVDLLAKPNKLWRSIKNSAWDEIKFDCVYEKIFSQDSTGSKMKYVYAKAGMLWKSNQWMEGCPYTAYPSHRRIILQTQAKQDIQESEMEDRIEAHWQGTVNACFHLMEAHLASSRLLPAGDQGSDAKGTVRMVLNHWSNAPLLLSDILYCSCMNS